MNVKISQDAVIFKITEAEMNALLAEGTLEEKLVLAGHAFSLKIRIDLSDISLKFEGSCLTMRITPDKIQKLADMGRSREGLSMNVGGTDVFLQVDVRADSRERMKA